MGHTVEVTLIGLILRAVIIALIRGLHFVLPMRNVGDAEMNAWTHDVRCLPLRATARARYGCGIVHTGVLVFVNYMGELALKYLRSSLHYIRVLLQCRSGLGYRSTLIQYISSVNLPVQHFFGCDSDKQTISTS